MKTILAFSFLLFFSVSVYALEGRWVLDSFIAQTIVDDQVYYAEDSKYPLIREIVFRTGKMAELFMQLDTDTPAEWCGASYSFDGSTLSMTVLGFGDIRAYYTKILPDRIRLSFSVYIGPDGLAPVSGKAAKAIRDVSAEAAGPEHSLRETQEDKKTGPPTASQDDHSITMGTAGATPVSDTAADVSTEETPKQLLVFSACFVLKK
ncbi:MAG: hypothetical protein JW874_01510 [Spirochaetales bacterium]|nr:hypothetical protein [Spirochaetales bacterium]